MNNDTVVSLAAPARVSDPLTELLRTGARRLVEAAVTAEFEEYLSGFVQEQLPDGRQRVVRNGHLPERKILTGLGEVDVRVPRRAKRASADAGADGRRRAAMDARARSRRVIGCLEEGTRRASSLTARFFAPEKERILEGARPCGRVPVPAV